MTVENFKTRLVELKKLFNEYKIENGIADEIELQFNSGKRSLGFVQTKTERTIKGVIRPIIKINLGSKSDPNAIDKRRAFLTESGRIQLSQGNKVDDINYEKLVTTHEFGHVIANSETAKITNNVKQLQYWDELKKIKIDYNNEVKNLYVNKDIKALDKIYVGKYAETNIDEFHAELFMEYKLSVNPSKYAILAGNLIDKYFKK